MSEPQIQYNSLEEMFKAMPDPRKKRGQRYEWSLLLTLITAALLSGEKNGRAIAAWVKNHASEILADLQPQRQNMPSMSTLDRALQQCNITILEQLVGEFTSQLSAKMTKPTQQEDKNQKSESPKASESLAGLALDGKEVRGVAKHDKVISLVALVEHDTANVLNQVSVEGKGHEIEAGPILLAQRDLRGIVITADALHTHQDFADLITKQNGHYLFIVKKNQPTLYNDIDLLFKTTPVSELLSYQKITITEKGHGRIETRMVERTTTLCDYVKWQGVKQILKRTCIRHNVKTSKKTMEISYAITDLCMEQVSIDKIAKLWRGHWTIENRVHYVRDETFGEDRRQQYKGKRPQVMAALTNTLMSLIRWEGWQYIPDALRHYKASAILALEFIKRPVMMKKSAILKAIAKPLSVKAA